MAPESKSTPTIHLNDGEQVEAIGPNEVATTAEILDGIREGYLFVMSGGKGQPIDDMHREIAEELAQDADISDSVDC